MSRLFSALGISLIAAVATAGAAMAAEGFPPLSLAFRPGAPDLILVLDESRRPRLFDFADPAQPKIGATLPKANAAAFLSATTIATGHDDGTIRRWTLDGRPDGEPVQASAKGIEAIKLSRSGRLVGSLDYDHALTLWTPALAKRAGPLLKPEKCEDEAEPRVWDIAFHPDEMVAATSTRCGNLTAWTVQGRLVPVVQPRQAPLIVAFAFSRDGTAVLTHYQAHPGAFNYLYPVAAGRIGPGRPLTGPLFKIYVSDILTAPDGGGFLFNGEGGLQRVSATGARGAVIPSAKGARIALSGDGKRIAGIGDKRLTLWDAAGKRLGEAPVGAPQ